MAELLAGKTDKDIEINDSTFILDFHPAYAQFGNIEESANIKKGTYQEGDEFLSIFVDDQYGEIVGAQSYHRLAKELIKELEFLIKLEVSIEDLVDLDTTEDLNGIIIQAAKNISNNEKD